MTILLLFTTESADQKKTDRFINKKSVHRKKYNKKGKNRKV